MLGRIVVHVMETRVSVNGGSVDSLTQHHEAKHQSDPSCTDGGAPSPPDPPGVGNP